MKNSCMAWLVAVAAMMGGCGKELCTGGLVQCGSVCMDTKNDPELSVGKAAAVQRMQLKRGVADRGDEDYTGEHGPNHEGLPRRHPI